MNPAIVKVIDVAVSVPVTSTLWDAGDVHEALKPTNEVHVNVVTANELARETTTLAGIILLEGVKVI